MAVSFSLEKLEPLHLRLAEPQLLFMVSSRLVDSCHGQKHPGAILLFHPPTSGHIGHSEVSSRAPVTESCIIEATLQREEMKYEIFKASFTLLRKRASQSMEEEDRVSKLCWCEGEMAEKIKPTHCLGNKHF
jgi:hypothetical protein